METATQTSSHKWWSRLDAVVLALLIVAMCSQFDVRSIGANTYKLHHFNTKQLFLAASDLMLLTAIVWFAVGTTFRQAWRRLWWPPLPCCALIFVMVLAAIHSTTINHGVAAAWAQAHGPKGHLKALLATKESKEAIADILQYCAYFVFAPLIFVNLIVDRRPAESIVRRRLAFHALAIAIVLNIVAALWQRAHGAIAPFGLFCGNDPQWRSPNIYGAFLAVSLPLLMANTLVLWKRSLPALIATLLCLAGALFTMTSPWSVIALLAGLLTAAIVTRRGRRAFVIAVVAMPFLLAWHAPSALKLRRGEIWTIRNQYEPVKKQYREWYAALGYSDPGQGKFATGVGPGNYQFNVGSYYLRLPAPGLEKMPPDSNNLYLVQAVSIGVLGLGTLLWLFGHFIGIARKTVRENRNDWLAAGVIASVAALAFVNLFHATIVRGMGLVMAFVISLAIVASIAPQAHDTEGETL